MRNGRQSGYVLRTVETRTFDVDGVFTTVDLTGGTWHLMAHDGDYCIKERWRGEFDPYFEGILCPHNKIIEIHVDGRDNAITYYNFGYSSIMYARRVAFVEIGTGRVLLPTIAP